MPAVPRIQRLWLCAAAVLCVALTLQAGGPEPLTIMSFTIRSGTADDGPNRWELRRGQLIDLLKRHDPDVLGVQEALHFQIDEILQRLPDYRMVGVGRSDGGQGGEYSAILYRTSRLSPPTIRHVLVLGHSRDHQVQYLGECDRTDLHLGPVRRQAGTRLLPVQPSSRSHLPAVTREERGAPARADRRTLTRSPGHRHGRFQHR